MLVPMMSQDRVLMGPGPSNPYPQVTAALARPVVGHLDAQFIELLDETNDRLRSIWRTDNPLTFPVSGTGSAGMEAAFVNLVNPGDVVVVGVNGVFGQRMCEVARRAGAQVVAVEAPWGEALDPEAVLAAHPEPAIMAVVHAETSTGVRNDIEPLAQRHDRTLLLVDCVTSLGGIPVEIDAWGVDIAYSGTQKCLGVPPGLAPITVSPKAQARIVERPQSWYLDLNLIAQYVTGEAARAYHHTAPISMIYALHAGLGAILEESLEQAWQRHDETGRALQAGLEDLGMKLFADAACRLPELTTVWVPEAHRSHEAEIRQELLERYEIEIGGGLGKYAGSVWRIGLMGHTARMRNVTLLLGALSEVFDR